jgi:hypothetical protein
MKEVLAFTQENWREAVILLQGLAVLTGLAFNRKQKEWIRERDDNHCQFPVLWTNHGYTPCGKEKYLQVHHVTPQRWARSVLKWPKDKIDSPDNGITLCSDHHQNVVHNPDMPLAKANYHRDKKSYQKAFRRRDELIEEGKVYWNTAFDALFRRIVSARNKNFDKEWPR